MMNEQKLQAIEKSISEAPEFGVDHVYPLLAEVRRYMRIERALVSAMRGYHKYTRTFGLCPRCKYHLNRIRIALFERSQIRSE